MNPRQHYLIGYDVALPKRLRKICKTVQVHSHSGQKSFYECTLSPAELQTVMSQLRTLIDSTQDRVIIVVLDARSDSITLGTGVKLNNDNFFLVA